MQFFGGLGKSFCNNHVQGIRNKVIQSFSLGEVKLLSQVKIIFVFFFSQKYLEEESSLVDGIVGFHDAIRKCEYFVMKVNYH